VNAPIDWHARAAAVRPDGGALIDGQRVAAADAQTFACVSPIDGRTLGQVARCQAPDIDRAVAGARRAFEDGRWRGQSPSARKKILLKFAELFAERARGAGAAGNARHGQAGPVQPERGRLRRGALHRVVRGGRRQGLRRDRADAAGGAGADPARTDGRDRGHRAVELPDDHGRLENRAGAGPRATASC